MSNEDKGANTGTLNLISAEVHRARLKFPGGKVLLPALMEEVGELADAILSWEPMDRIKKEAVQVCAMGVRIIEEGIQDDEHSGAVVELIVRVGAMIRLLLQKRVGGAAFVCEQISEVVQKIAEGLAKGVSEFDSLTEEESKA